MEVLERYRPQAMTPFPNLSVLFSLGELGSLLFFRFRSLLRSPLLRPDPDEPSIYLPAFTLLSYFFFRYSLVLPSLYLLKTPLAVHPEEYF